jgi:hypothetical protein
VHHPAPRRVGEPGALCSAHPERASTAFTRSRATSFRVEPPTRPTPKRPRALRARTEARSHVAGARPRAYDWRSQRPGAFPIPKDRFCSQPSRPFAVTPSGLPPGSSTIVAGTSRGSQALAVMAVLSAPVSLLSRPRAPLQLVLRRPPGCRWSAPASRGRFCAGFPSPFPPSWIVAPSPESSVTPLPVNGSGSVRPSLRDRRPSARDGLVIPPPVPQAVGWQCTRMQRSRRGPRATAETVPTCPPQPELGPTYAAGCGGRSPRNRAVRDRADAA